MERNECPLKEGQYFSILHSVDYESTISRSRFIASLRYAKARSDFDECLKEIACLYPKATHHCWAYRFAAHPALEHASDAGEPPGTAGRPILGALKKHSLENIAAIVTRYYGGVKLGVKGLISAYERTTLMAIENAEIVIREPIICARFECSYDMYNIILNILQKNMIPESSLKTLFEENISGEVQIPKSSADKILFEFSSLQGSNRFFKYSISNGNG